MKIYWTYSKLNLKASEVREHEKAKVKFSDEKSHIGGLGRSPIITHCINKDGMLFVLDYCPGTEIHLALIGGLSLDNCYQNTATKEQLLTLSNIVRFYLSLGEPIQEGDFSNFDLKTWLKAINK
jgi:hypothetical protein